MTTWVRGLDGQDRRVQLVATRETSLAEASEHVWGVSRLLAR